MKIKYLLVPIFLPIISVFFALFLIEIYLGYFLVFHSPIDKYKFNDTFDYRTRYEVYHDMKKNNPNVVLNLEPYHFYKADPFPLSSISRRVNILCNENETGQWTTYISDRYGFNNPDNEWDKKEIEYFIVGDSFAQGYCVEEKDNIAGNLRSISGLGVLNLAIGGNGPLIEYATLREYLPLKKVKKILMFYYEGNDFINLQNSFKSKGIIEKYYLDPNFTQNLPMRTEEVDKYLINQIAQEEKKYQKIDSNRLNKDKVVVRKVDKFYKELLEERSKKSTLIKIWKLFRNSLKFTALRDFLNKAVKKYNAKKNSYSVKHSTSKIDLQRFENIMKMTKQIAKENNAEFYFIYLPRFTRYIQSDRWYGHETYDKVKKIIKKLDIEIIDLHIELFSKMRDQLIFSPARRGEHYNEAGYKSVAEIVYQKTKN